MSYMVEYDREKDRDEFHCWRVLYIDSVSTQVHYVDSRWRTEAEAIERCSYLNGGLDPEFKAAILERIDSFLDAYARANQLVDGLAGVIDPRALQVPRCAHGKLATEPCVECSLCSAPIEGGGTCMRPYGHEGEHGPLP